MALSKKGIWKFTFITLLFLALMGAWLGFGERGFIHLYRMEKDRQAHIERIHKLEKENQVLFDEIKRLRADKEYLESVARAELGLLKDNEVLYRFNREEEKRSPSQTKEEKRP
ncbi:MAG: septum formation initiator family protein [Deltaproteobacteria bacterium]|nr:MAG: septum formation initiator family protein [Deltaproteobacteria bacterium]